MNPRRPLVIIADLSNLSSQTIGVQPSWVVFLWGFIAGILAMAITVGVYYAGQVGIVEEIWIPSDSGVNHDPYQYTYPDATLHDVGHRDI